MYGFVPYQLSGIQKGIQFAHALVEYSLKYGNTDEYKDWANNHKTFVILNGGTTNDNITDYYYGYLNKILDDLKKHDINVATFHEPDLGNQLTSICFIVDERVFDKINYPDFIQSKTDIIGKIISTNNYLYESWKQKFSNDETEQEKIIYLREFLKDKKLA